MNNRKKQTDSVWNNGNPFPDKISTQDHTYIIRFVLNHSEQRLIGKKGSISFPAGDYYYVGSARKNLIPRVNRHLGLCKEKKKHWHIDYLLESSQISELSARTFSMDECILADLLQKSGEFYTIDQFGCSDCSCQTHLFIKTK